MTAALDTSRFVHVTPALGFVLPDTAKDYPPTHEQAEDALALARVLRVYRALRWLRLVQ